MDETFGIRIFNVFWTFLNFGYFQRALGINDVFFCNEPLVSELSLNIEQAW